MPAMQNFVRVLAENHRLLLLPEIAAHYEELRSRRSKTPSTSRWSPPCALDAAQAEKLNAGA